MHSSECRRAQPSQRSGDAGTGNLLESRANRRPRRFDESVARALLHWGSMDARIRRPTVLCTAALLIGILGALPAQAQVVVKVNDDVNFKLGVLGQFQADTIDNPEPEPNTSNLFVRRLRLIFGGQVAKNVSFFVETDAPNLGKTLPGGKNIQPSLILQDAFAELHVADAQKYALRPGCGNRPTPHREAAAPTGRPLSR